MFYKQQVLLTFLHEVFLGLIQALFYVKHWFKQKVFYLYFYINIFKIFNHVVFEANHFLYHIV